MLMKNTMYPSFKFLSLFYFFSIAVSANGAQNPALDDGNKRSPRWLEVGTAFAQVVFSKPSGLLPRLGIVVPRPEGDTLEFWEVLARRYCMVNNFSAALIEGKKIGEKEVTSTVWYGVIFEFVDVWKVNQDRFSELVPKIVRV
jgi:hypothetical protein